MSINELYQLVPESLHGNIAVSPGRLTIKNPQGPTLEYKKTTAADDSLLTEMDYKPVDVSGLESRLGVVLRCAR